jgi:multiple sugar transport system substrate-binding protein
VDRLRGPDPGPASSTSPAEGGRLPGRLLRAAAVHGATGTKITALRDKYATINESYYSSFVNANEASDGEPVDAQAVYKSLDPVMLAVLTEPNANIPALLKTARRQRQHDLLA